MNKEVNCTGGAVTPINFNDVDKPTTRWQITMIGRATGVITLKAKAYKSDVFETITGVSVIDPAVRRTLIVNGRLDALQIDDSANVAAQNFVISVTSLN